VTLRKARVAAEEHAAPRKRRRAQIPVPGWIPTASIYNEPRNLDSIATYLSAI
jgi:hypothetical protein